MIDNLWFSKTVGVGALAFSLAMSSICEAEQVRKNPVVDSQVAPKAQLQEQNNLATLVTGHNDCYMVQAYFSKAILDEILPKGLSIPDDEIMAEYYPETELRDDAHPFMMTFCHGSDIHDIHTKIDVPEQEEIMFTFPVMYMSSDGESYLCSYVPVLYLDSLVGVMGGLVFGLRKEFHAAMEHGEIAEGNWWRIDGIIDASFSKSKDQVLTALPQFIEQTFANPFVTFSYQMPFARMYVYEAEVYPSEVIAAEETFLWNYKGTAVQEDAGTSSVYSVYDFSMSWPVAAKKYFK